MHLCWRRGFILICKHQNKKYSQILFTQTTRVFMETPFYGLGKEKLKTAMYGVWSLPILKLHYEKKISLTSLLMSAQASLGGFHCQINFVNNLLIIRRLDNESYMIENVPLGLLQYYMTNLKKKNLFY